MENRTVRSVAIIGGGVTGWMSAALLSNMLGTNVSVHVVDMGEKGGTDASVTTLPPIKALHQSLGFNEADLISKCQGSMKLGTQFVNWARLGDRYFHPHGSYGAEFDVVPLHQWWLKASKTDNLAPALEDLSMAWALSRQARFTIPVPDRRLVQSTFDYAYHLDAKLYADYLAAFATAQGVSTTQGSVQNVVRDTASGFVTQVVLTDGLTIVADLYLDCSGQEAVLSQQELGSGFHDWSQYLPCNRLVALSCAKGGEFTPYTKAIARDAGWQWRIPLQHKTSMGYVFQSELISDDDAISGLMDNLDGPTLSQPICRSFKNGRSAKSFSHNVVAIGDAAGFLEPLEATNIHMIQSSLTRLLALWPTRDCQTHVADEYNRVTAAEWDLARDFLVLHYKATTRSDTALWKTTQAMTLPSSLETRLQHWTSFGRLISPQAELFQSASWLSVFVGQGIMPESWDPLVEARSNRVDFLARLQGLKNLIGETATQMPVHKDWIDKHARGVRH
jgi:tryptophan 7-halogenase